MQTPVTLGALASDQDWEALAKALGPGCDVLVLRNLVSQYRSVGARSFILENAYIDRDFSAAYAAFYATLFHPYQKYCRRLHVFAEDVTGVMGAPTAEDVARALEAHQPAYLGFAVLRPLEHAPLGMAVVNSEAVASAPSAQMDVRAEYRVHLLGADLSVLGFPLTQQDSRVGACAQATIWMVGRHIHRKHGGPWFSMPEINEVALKPTDGVTSRSLPAGSDFLTPDNMVRALRAMDRHPVVFVRQPDENGQPIWTTPIREIVCRYLDSGVPIILGLKGRDGAAVGHAVVAVGRTILEKMPDPLPDDPTWAESATHLLVHDDQRGAYQALPVREADRSQAYPWTLEEDAVYAIVPLPSKVFMTAEAAEELTWSYVETLIERAGQYRDHAQAAAGGPPLGDITALDPDFFAAGVEGLVARTYLTYGWKYKRRALRNKLPAGLKADLIAKELPRYVWVTEFSLPGDLASYNVCDRKVRAHVVIDATGSRHWQSAILVQIPGVAMLWGFDLTSPSSKPHLVIRAFTEAEPFLPKVRGWKDYDRCEVKPDPAPLPPPASPKGD